MRSPWSGRPLDEGGVPALRLGCRAGELLGFSHEPIIDEQVRACADPQRKRLVADDCGGAAFRIALVGRDLDAHGPSIEPRQVDDPRPARGLVGGGEPLHLDGGFVGANRNAVIERKAGDQRSVGLGQLNPELALCAHSVENELRSLAGADEHVPV